MLINLPGTAAAEDSDEDAEHVTGVGRSPADDELRLGCVIGVGFADDVDGGFMFTSDVPAFKQKTNA